MINYVPEKRTHPTVFTGRPTAWGDIPTIIIDIIERFNINPKRALEFGTEFGYSTSALANYFEEVTGVDIFTGDIHAGFVLNHYEDTKANIAAWPNIQLIESDYRDFIKKNNERYDMIHIDIIHTYEATFECGEWAVNHSNVTIFHDTESFPEIKRVCNDLAIKYDLEFYNYSDSHGLGILVKK